MKSHIISIPDVVSTHRKDNNSDLYMLKYAQSIICLLLRYHVLDLGCQHVRGELSMSNGELDRDRKCAHPIEYRPCVNRCPICTGEWHKSFLTVDRKKIVQFLQHIDQKKIPLNAKADNIVDLLWSETHEKWHIKDVLRTTKVPKYNVDSLFLQLIANGMII